ncbi:hypothetical protein [Limnohabitans sp. DM1]|uniref:hypothetical protein n=1 Tax=Limnohabitans sp. DM1 TaxID=1597955 RepID=UPI0018929171|nr:hypothetical protein [Limnohabitans sp. DM1]
MPKANSTPQKALDVGTIDFGLLRCRKMAAVVKRHTRCIGLYLVLNWPNAAIFAHAVYRLRSRSMPVQRLDCAMTQKRSASQDGMGLPYSGGLAERLLRLWLLARVSTEQSPRHNPCFATPFTHRVGVPQAQTPTPELTIRAVT